MDLEREQPVTLAEAVAGGKVEAPTVSGSVTLTIPSGSNTGTQLRLKGKGMKNLQGYGHGDLHVRVLVEVPTKLTGEQRKKLEEFSALCNGKESPLAQNFFEKAKKFFQ